MTGQTITVTIEGELASIIRKLTKEYKLENPFETVRAAISLFSRLHDDKLIYIDDGVITFDSFHHTLVGGRTGNKTIFRVIAFATIPLLAILAAVTNHYSEMAGFGFLFIMFWLAMELFMAFVF